MKPKSALLDFISTLCWNISSMSSSLKSSLKRTSKAQDSACKSITGWLLSVHYNDTIYNWEVKECFESLETRFIFIFIVGVFACAKHKQKIELKEDPQNCLFFMLFYLSSLSCFCLSFLDALQFSISIALHSHSIHVKSSVQSSLYKLFIALFCLRLLLVCQFFSDFSCVFNRILFALD